MAELKPHLAIIIPFFNETSLMAAHLNRLQQFLKDQAWAQNLQVSIVLVDDGSKAPFQTPLESNTHLLRHLINLGQGAALQTGIEFAVKKLKSDFFVTMDADGQHRCEDLQPLLAPVLNGQVDIVFGNRFAEYPSHAPALRKLILKGGILFERVITRLDLSDSHNGYRAFNRKAAEIMNIQLNRMAHATEIKQIVARNHLSYTEVAVQILYTDETLKKGQRNLGAFIILKDLFSAYLFKKTN